jgi:hypothetical protein
MLNTYHSVTDNSYRTRYVGEALRSMGKDRVKYTENSNATEVLCQTFTCYTHLNSIVRT